MEMEDLISASTGTRMFGHVWCEEESGAGTLEERGLDEEEGG